MTVIAGDAPSYKALSVKPERTAFCLAVTIGASGAVGAHDGDDPAMLLTKNGGTGDYTLAFPKAPRGWFNVVITSPAGTIKGYGTLAFDPTTGALNIITHNGAGTATNPASGDVIRIMLELDVRG